MDDDVYEDLKQIFPEVDPEILKLIANEHGDDMDAATTAVVGDIEYYQLRLIFPMVEADIVKAISSEYRNNLDTAIKTIIDEVVFYIPVLHNNNQNNHHSSVEESVDHRILKEVSLNRKYNLDAPIEVVMDNSVFEQLKDIFPLVDDEILRAIADEHSDNADVAIDDILHQVVPYTQNDTDGSNGPEI